MVRRTLTNEIMPDIHIEDLESLLIKDASKEFIQSKWYKKVIEGDIDIKKIAYTLQATSNKREAVYVDGFFNNTKPFNYDEIINNS